MNKELKKKAWRRVMEKYIENRLPSEESNKKFAEEREELIRKEMELIEKEKELKENEKAGKLNS